MTRRPDDEGSAADGPTRPLPSETPSDLSRTVLGGIGVTTMGFVASRALTLAFYLVLARLAAPAVFGNFAAGSILIGVGGVFVESGMLAALIHRRDRLEEAASTALLATVLGGCALSLGALAAAPFIGLVFSSREVGLVAAAVSGVLLVGSAKVVPDALLQRRFSFARRVVVDPIGVIAFGSVSIVALDRGLGVWALVLGTYASEVAQVGASWKASHFRPDLRLASFGMWRELSSYGRHVLAGAFIDHVGLIANTVLLGRFVSESALGQFRYALRFGILPHEVVVSAGSYVLFPALARISDDMERLERAFLRALRWVMAAVVPASLVLVALGPPLVVLLLGERWRPAGEALMVLCIWSAPKAVGSLAAESLKAAGRPDVLPPLHLLQALLSIVLMVALLPWGLVGISAGVALASVLGEGYSLVRTCRVLDFDGRAVVSEIWPPYVAAATMLAVLLPLDRLWVRPADHGIAVGLGLLVTEGLVGLAVYVATLTLFAPPTAKELVAGFRAVRAGRRGTKASPSAQASKSPSGNA